MNNENFSQIALDLHFITNLHWNKSFFSIQDAVELCIDASDYQSYYKLTQVAHPAPLSKIKLGYSF